MHIQDDKTNEIIDKPISYVEFNQNIVDLFLTNNNVDVETNDKIEQPS